MLAEMDVAQALLSIVAGIGLAAAAGLRAFLPLAAASIAAYLGWYEPSAGFAWLATEAAVIALSVAAVAEVLAYYLPGLDHVLDLIGAPVALIAGVVAAAAVMVDVPTWLRWVSAIAIGGSATASLYGVTSLIRAKSGATTGGLGNPVVATGELAGATGLAVVALLAPLLALVLLIVVFAFALTYVRRRRRQRVS